MPDIFGRTPEDYAHVRAYQRAGQWEARQAFLARSRPHSHNLHDFDFLGGVREGGPFPAPLKHLERAEPNAQAIGFATHNLLAIQAAVDEILYLRYRLPEYVYLNMNIPDGADSYLVRVLDRTGRGSFITNFGTDAPVAQVSQRGVQHDLHYAGIDAIYSVEDMRNAAFAGFPLDVRVLQAAVMGGMEHMEEVVLIGSDQIPGSTGLLNQTTGTGGVNLQTQGASAKFSDLQPEGIRDLINDDISWINETSKETFGYNIDDGMTVYLPTQQYNRLATRFIGDNEDRSVMRAIMEDNSWSMRTGNPVMFRSVPELNNRGVSNVDRMMVACRDDRVYEAGVSIPPRVLRIMDKGRGVCIMVEYKFSTLFMKRPTVCRYRDNV